MAENVNSAQLVTHVDCVTMVAAQRVHPDARQMSSKIGGAQV